MSAQSIREDLAAAASLVEGVTCSPYYVQATSPGAAWVKTVRTEYPNAFGSIRHWSVVVVLPQDLAAAEQYLDDVLPLVATEVAEHLYITEISGVQRYEIPGVGALLTASIVGRREQE